MKSKKLFEKLIQPQDECHKSTMKQNGSYIQEKYHLLWRIIEAKIEIFNISILILEWEENFHAKMNAEKFLHSSFYCKYFTYDIRFILESAKPIIDDPRVYEELYKIVAQPEVFRQDCMLSSEYIFRFLEKLSMNFYEYLCIYENISYCCTQWKSRLLREWFGSLYKVLGNFYFENIIESYYKKNNWWLFEILYSNFAWIEFNNNLIMWWNDISAEVFLIYDI